MTHAIHAHYALTYIFGQAATVFARKATRVNPIAPKAYKIVSPPR